MKGSTMRFTPRLLAALLLVGSLAACGGSNRPAVPECRGPVFPLNPGLWTPTDAELSK